MILTDPQLATTCKVLSIRRQNLYSSLAMHKQGSERWEFFNEQISEVSEALSVLEAERDQRRLSV